MPFPECPNIILKNRGYVVSPRSIVCEVPITIFKRLETLTKELRSYNKKYERAPHFFCQRKLYEVPGKSYALLEECNRDESTVEYIIKEAGFIADYTNHDVQDLADLLPAANKAGHPVIKDSELEA